MTAAYAIGAGACVTIESPEATRARLIARRDALPPGSHKRAALDERIRLITHAMLEGRK